MITDEDTLKYDVGISNAESGFRTMLEMYFSPHGAVTAESAILLID
jgi:hypothetical protein